MDYMLEAQKHLDAARASQSAEERAAHLEKRRRRCASRSKPVNDRCGRLRNESMTADRLRFEQQMQFPASRNSIAYV